MEHRRRKKADGVRHPILGRTVTIEERTGSGVMTRVVWRRDAFGKGVPRIEPCCCRPGIHHCMDTFYGRIDRDLADWEYERDLALRVPYAVKRDRWEKRMKRLVRRHKS